MTEPTTATLREAGRIGRLVLVCGAAWAVLLLTAGPARAQVFSTGSATVTLAGRVARLPLFVWPGDSGTSGVQADVEGRPSLGLDFGELAHGTIEATIHLTVNEVHGPGRYDSAQIGALSMMYAAGGETWLYDPRLNACTCTLTKLDGNGVAGTIRCTGSRVNHPPFSTIRFEAAP